MKKVSSAQVTIIGAGLAGSEAAWQLASSGIQVELIEMRPQQRTAAHQGGDCAELVCSNSFRSDDAEYNAVGVLHAEMRLANSLIMRQADLCQIPAGSALAVDRELFAQGVTRQLENHPLITLSRREMTSLPLSSDQQIIVATGPLTAAPLSESIKEITGAESLAFFDAIAPVVYTETIDFSKAWYQSRYDKKGPGGDGRDYINCPLTQEEYETFIDALLNAPYHEFKEWEKDTPYFEGCLPIEVMAARGRETLRFGPMKPVGLTNPHTGQRPYAVVQLRQDNKMASLYNLVGFQTKMAYGAQKEILRKIPGLGQAEFARLGGIHRNCFIQSPLLLDQELRLKSHPHLRFAGQITGVEGYVESAAIGLLAGRFAAAHIRGQNSILPPQTTAMGALLHHITGGAQPDIFQPMNINFGLFSTVEKLEKGKKLKGRERKLFYSQRALQKCQEWLAQQDNKIYA